MSRRPPPGLARGSFANVVARLSGVNLIVLLSGVVTAPITARALGPDGRGELAAIVAVLVIAPVLLDLGLTQWVARERALGTDTGQLLGAALPVAFGCSLIGVLAAVPLSHAIGGDREVVIVFVQVGLFLTPVAVLLQTLVGIAIGEARWRIFSAVRVASFALPAIAIVALALADRLTVATAAGAYLGLGLASNLVLLRLVRGVRHLPVSLSRSLAAIKFGAKTWVGTWASTANVRLDQLLMAGLVPSRELGFYAVAGTITGIPFTLIAAINNALFARVAVGDGDLAARASRVSLLIVAVVGAPLAAASPVLVPFVFGTDFSAAVPMLLVLLLASLPAAPAYVLQGALPAANQPGAAMRAELVALAVTLPALVLLLPRFGGMGAAVITVVACVIRLGMQLRSAQRTFEIPWWSFVVPTTQDAAWIRDQGRAVRRARSG